MITSQRAFKIQIGRLIIAIRIRTSVEGRLGSFQIHRSASLPPPTLQIRVHSSTYSTPTMMKVPNRISSAGTNIAEGRPNSGRPGIISTPAHDPPPEFVGASSRRKCRLPASVRPISRPSTPPMPDEHAPDQLSSSRSPINGCATRLIASITNSSAANERERPARGARCRSGAAPGSGAPARRPASA